MAITMRGALKIAAKKSGLSLLEYAERIYIGLLRCTDCKQWKPWSEFCSDTSRGSGRSATCSECKNAIRPRSHKRLKPAQDGDRRQANNRVKFLVSCGVTPHPDALPCFYCDHFGEDKSHGYHHYLGYAPENHEQVRACCSRCHRLAHAGDNRHLKRKRAKNGRFL